MKYGADKPYGDGGKAARKLIEIANAAEAVQDGRIYIEQINEPMLFEHKASPAETRRVLIWQSSVAGWCWTGHAPA
jgi:hypothetical protein